MELQVRGVTFGYDTNKNVLENVSLSYRSPETLCVLGANGAGKSTLLKNIVGECVPQRGDVLVDGHPVQEYSARQLARKIAYIPQDHAPMFPFSVLDVVLMGGTARLGYFATPGRGDEASALEKLDFLKIGHLSSEPYTEISGGERQLVMIAAALNQEPDVLILDEPTSHLDFGNQHRFLELVMRLRDQEKGVIMTTHFPDHALELGGTTVVMKHSGILATGLASEVVTPTMMSDLYDIDVQVLEVGGRRLCVPGESSPGTDEPPIRSR